MFGKGLFKVIEIVKGQNFTMPLKEIDNMEMFFIILLTCFLVWYLVKNHTHTHKKPSKNIFFKKKNIISFKILF